MLNLICFARTVRSTCFRASISAKSDLLDEGLGKCFSHNWKIYLPSIFRKAEILKCDEVKGNVENCY